MPKKSLAFFEDCYKNLELIRRRIPYKIQIKPSSLSSSSKKHVKEILVLSDIKELKEARIFIEAYETVSQSNFHIVSNKSDPNRSVCNIKWICTHGTVSGFNKACSASINITIKTDSNENMLQDDLLEKEHHLPAIIRINPSHTHRLIIPLSNYKLLRINNDVKLCFYEYFKRGYFGGKAKHFHQQYLRKAQFCVRKDESMNPTVRAIYTLANNWLKQKESMEENKASDKERFPNLQAGNVINKNETEKLSSQNPENIVYIDDVKTKFKKVPGDEYIIPEIISNEILEPQTILTIKQEILDEDENDEYTALSNEQSSQNFINIDDVVANLKKEPDDEYIGYQNSTNEILGVQAATCLENIKQEIMEEDEKAGLPVISSYNSLAVPSSSTLPLKPSTVKTSTIKRTASAITKSATSVAKMVQPSSSQVVVYDLPSNTYKVVKCLSVNSGTYSATQYKPYSPNVLVPMRISLQKF